VVFALLHHLSISVRLLGLAIFNEGIGVEDYCYVAGQGWQIIDEPRANLYRMAAHGVAGFKAVI
jgi:hypothetical protein